MANNYTGSYAGIAKGGQITARQMTDALNQMEKVGNKKDVVINSSTEYPSSKAVMDYAASLAFFPVGTILTFSSAAWSAAGMEFKKIWKICDGQNGTPNLINKFLRGGTSSGGSYNNPTTGNAQAITLTKNNLPYLEHSHDLEFKGEEATGNIGNLASDENLSNSVVFRLAGGVFSGAGHVNPNNAVIVDHTGSGATGYKYVKFSHTPAGSVDCDPAGIGVSSPTALSVNVMPSYYTVIYIMKTL